MIYLLAICCIILLICIIVLCDLNKKKTDTIINYEIATLLCASRCGSMHRNLKNGALADVSSTAQKVLGAFEVMRTYCPDYEQEHLTAAFHNNKKQIPGD